MFTIHNVTKPSTINAGLDTGLVILMLLMSENIIKYKTVIFTIFFGKVLSTLVERQLPSVN